MPELILTRVRDHIPSWSLAQMHDISIKRLSGLNNACYRVALNSDFPIGEAGAPRTVLYRKFQNENLDLSTEKEVFKKMSQSGLGPRSYYQDSRYRVEEFFEGRPLSVWELRNPQICKVFAKALYDFHTNSGVAEAMQESHPKDENKLGIDIAINVWGPEAAKKISRLRRRLNESDDDHAVILRAISALEDTFLLKEGYQKVLSSLVSRQNAVFSHNDIQENNMLASLEDNNRLILIDFEYAWWNPRFFDLGNYINEFVSDYTHPIAPGIHFYWSNMATNEEIESIVREYWTLMTGNERPWSLTETECAEALMQTKACMLLNDY